MYSDRNIQENAFTSFTQKYKSTEELSALTDLNLTPNEGFNLKQLFDLNELNQNLSNLVRLNIHGNSLSNLTLKNFNRLSILIASSNMLTECSLSLTKLQKLDLSSNFLKNIPLLIFTPELVELNLSKNLIDKVQITDLSPVQKTLRILHLSYNQINFPTVNEFISFVDKLKYFNLREFSLNANSFIENNPIVANSYKTLLMLSLNNLVLLDNEQISLSDDIVNENEIIRQMLYEENQQNKNKKAFYTQFSQVHKDKNKNKKILKLHMTPLESFLLNDIDDLCNEYAYQFDKLVLLDIRDNLIKHINIGINENDFPSLKLIQANNNRITSITMKGLKSLKEVNYGDNLLTEIPDFRNVKGDVKVIILNNNNINNISFVHIEGLSHLNVLNLANNNIDIISEENVDKEICMGFMEFNELNTLRFDENPFCKNAKIYKYFITRMSDYFFSEGRKFKVNGEELKRVKKGKEVNLKIFNKSSDNNNVYLKDKNAQQYDDNNYISAFKSINYILEKLIQFNGNNQLLYFDLLNQFNDVFEIENDNNNNCINENSFNQFKNIYNTFLMNCNEFINLNSNYEAQIIKTLAQLALIQQLNVNKLTLDFFKLYISNDENKKQLVQNVIETIMITNLQLSNSNQFGIITEIISFFKDTNISSSILYRNLILNIIAYINSLDLDEVKKKTYDSKQTDDYVNSLNFIIEYLKDFYNKKQIDINSNNSSNSAEDTITVDNNDNDSEISKDDSVDQTDDKVLNNFLYVKGINELTGEQYVDTGISELIIKVNKYLISLHQTIITNDDTVINNNIFGHELLESIAKDNSLEQMKLFDAKDRTRYEQVIYYYTFLNSFQSCYSYLIDLSSYFSGYKSNTPVFQNQIIKFYKNIELLTTLITTFNPSHFKNNSILKQIQINFLINSLDDLVTRFFVSKDESSPSHDKLIAKFILNLPGYNDTVKQMVITFLSGIENLLDCIGALISFLTESEFVKIIDNDRLDKYYNVITNYKADPQILEGTCKLMKRILNCNHLFNKEICALKVFTKSNYFKVLLCYIDYSKAQYRSAVDTLVTKEEKKNMLTVAKLKNIQQNPYDFTVINSKKLFSYIESIIDIFVAISKYSKNTNSKEIRTMMEELSNGNVYTLLGNCLQIEYSDSIRKKVVECFYNFDHKEITNDIILHIIEIVNKYNSIYEGETEYVLSLIYLMLNNKLMDGILNGNNEIFPPMKIAVNAGVKYLIQNNERNPHDEEELRQKNSLSVSIIQFLITASCIPELYGEFFGESSEAASYALLKRVLILDYQMFCSEYYVPLEIERTHLGMYLVILFEVIEGLSCLMPYSYVFLRVIMKMADILCGCKEYCYYMNKIANDDEDNNNIKEGNESNENVGGLSSSSREFFDKLINECNERMLDKFINESKNWYEFQTDMGDKRNVFMKIMNDAYNTISITNENDIYDNMNTSYTLSYTQDNTEPYASFATKTSELQVQPQYKKKGFNIIDYYYQNSKHNILSNSRYKTSLPKHSLTELITEQINFIICFPNLFNFLLGTKSNLNETTIYQDLSRKFNSELLNSEKIYEVFNSYTNYGNINTVLGNIKHFDNEIPFSTQINKSILSKLKSNDYESHLQASNLLYHQVASKSQNVLNNFNYENELHSCGKYGFNKYALRKKNEENVNNPHLRSLIINAFLRCIYGIILSPSDKIRNDFIEQLFIDNKYKNLLLLVSTQKYYNGYHFYHILQEIFQGKNMYLIKKACVTKKAVRYDSALNDSNTMKEKLNDIIFKKNVSNNNESNNENNNELNHELYEMNLFHNLYITAIYLQREIIKYSSDDGNNNNEFLFLYSFEKAIIAFMDFYIGVKYKIVDEYFRYNFIVKKICGYKHYEFIFKLIEMLKQYMTYSFNIAKIIKETYLTLGVKLFNYGIGEVPSVSEVIDNKINIIINYISTIETEIQKLNELIALFTILNETTSNDIMNKILSLSTENSVNSFVYNVKAIQSKIKFINEFDLGYVLMTMYVDVDLYASNQQINQLLIKNGLKEFYGIMSNRKVLLFKKSVDIKKDTWDINNEPLIEITINDIKKVICFDYTRRVIIEVSSLVMSDKVNGSNISNNSNASTCDIYISLLFSSPSYTADFIKKLHSIKHNIPIYKSLNLSKQISTIENSNAHQLSLLQERAQKSNKNTKEQISTAKQIYYETLKPYLEETFKFRLTNSIQENISPSHNSVSIINKQTILCTINNNSNQIIHFSTFYFYIVSQTLPFLNQTQFNYFNDECLFESEKNVFNIDKIILYEDVLDIKSEDKKKEVEIVYKERKKGRSANVNEEKLIIKCNGDVDYSLIMLGLVKVEECAMDKFVKTKTNKKKGKKGEKKESDTTNGSITAID